MKSGSAVMIVVGVLGAIVSLMANNLLTAAASILLSVVGVFTLSG